MGFEEMRKRFMTDSDLYDPNLTATEADSRFGHIAKYPVGSTFKSRKECSLAGVHPSNFAGIAGNRNGAYSICMSGGYEDDVDEGDTFIYTGTGGQKDSFSTRGNQIEDQTFEHKNNAALKKSCEDSRPVRVIRGQNPNSKYAPSVGYRYDGLYHVRRAYLDYGQSGYIVCKYELVRLTGQPPLTVKTF